MKRVYKITFLIIIALLCVGCAKHGEDKNPSQGQAGQSTELDKETEEIGFGTEQNKTETQTENTEDEAAKPEPADEDMVLILDYIPDMVIDLKYATTDNFTGQVIYENNDAYLRYGTIRKLMKVQEELKAKGYKLVLWDGYRPVEAQFKLWDICPDSRYVSNPNKGFSKHSRGNTVDITIVTLDGQTVEMPTGFDDFTKEADRDYSDVSEMAAQNSQMLEDIMTKAGFKGYSGEWWHYSDTTEYPVIE